MYRIFDKGLAFGYHQLTINSDAQQKSKKKSKSKD